VNLDHPEHAEAIASVRNQQQAAQRSVSRAVMVSTDGLGKQDDGIHYNAQGQMELGKRFAKAYIQQMK
jgi:hypothetical protein